MPSQRPRSPFSTALRAVARFVALVGLAGGLVVAPARAELPHAGIDLVAAAAGIQIEMQGQPPEFVRVTGAALVRRGSPTTDSSGLMAIDAQMLALRLGGTSASLGDVQVMLQPGAASTGKIMTLTPGSDFPASLMFDVFFHVTLPGRDLSTAVPYRLQATITSIPWREVLEPGAPQSVDLIESGGASAGMITHAALDFYPLVNCLSTLATMDWKVQQGSAFVQETVNFVGQTTLIRSAAFDSGDGLLGFNSEIVSMNLVGKSQTRGTLFFGERMDTGSPGGGKALTTAGEFPADSFFDVFFEINDSSQSYMNRDALPERAVVNACPPIGTPYVSPSGLALTLVNRQKVQTAELDSFKFAFVQDLHCCRDQDQDGVFAAPCGNDCNDSNPGNFPGNLENCSDGSDNNCNRLIDCHDPLCLAKTCDDRNACTETDRCDASGACTGTSRDCNDNNPCTKDSCDASSGQCVHEPTPVGTPCDDGNACTDGDVCDGAAKCGGTLKQCADGNVCTDDRCDPQTGQCVFPPLTGAPCDDGSPCTVLDACNSDGVCTGRTKDCDDHNSCTGDHCDPATGACVNVPLSAGTPCDDGSACTDRDVCDGAGHCAGQLKTCDDGNACTQDSCDPAGGTCTHAPVPDQTPCSDGLFCDGDEACQAGQCVTVQRRNCDDGNPCTADRCDEVNDICVHVPVPDAETAAGADGQCNTADDNLALFGPDQRCGTLDDGMGDGVSCGDNCPLQYNPDQRDSDGDGIGDACDPSPCPQGAIVLSLPDDAVGASGAVASVPLAISDVTGAGVLSADVRVHFNPAVLTVDGVDAGQLTGACPITTNQPAPDTLVLSMYCTEPLTGAGSIAVIRFMVVGAFGEGTPLDFAGAVLNEGRPAVCADPGHLTIPTTAGIEGSFRYYRDDLKNVEPSDKPVAGVTVQLDGTGPGVPDTAVSDGTGRFGFRGKPLDESYRVTPSKGDDFQGAITSFDAALNAQGVVGLVTLTDLQRLAADVSGDGTQSSFDSALMARFVVGLIGRLPVAERLGSDWFMFPVPSAVPNETPVHPDPPAGVPGHIQYSPLVTPASGQDFLAGLFGDVSGNWMPSTAGSLVSSASAAASEAGGGTLTTRTTGKVRGGTAARLSVSDVVGAPGRTVRVAVTAEGAELAVAFDLDLRFDPTLLRLLTVESGRAASRFTLTSNLAEPGRARISMFDARALDASGEIVVLSFELVGSARRQSPLALSASVDEGRIPVSVRSGTVRLRPGR